VYTRLELWYEYRRDRKHIFVAILLAPAPFSSFFFSLWAYLPFFQLFFRQRRAAWPTPPRRPEVAVSSCSRHRASSWSRAQLQVSDWAARRMLVGPLDSQQIEQALIIPTTIRCVSFVRGALNPGNAAAIVVAIVAATLVRAEAVGNSENFRRTDLLVDLVFLL
jgi:hypothetical protein